MENENKMEEILRLVEDIQSQLARLKQLMTEDGDFDIQESIQEKASTIGDIREEKRGTVVEGVFDGQNMVGPTGKVYTVPANYASKSKLVEGDIMKLTITDDGSFIYKQIGPVKRKREMSTLVHDEEAGTYKALTGRGRSYRLLTASVTYYKGQPGDTVIALVPEEMDSKWAAVENIIRDTGATNTAVQSEDDWEDIAHELELPSPSAELGSGSDMELPAPSAELNSGSDMELPIPHAEDVDTQP